jgi:DNA invertase Pin-like site-specific DNA recombinase
MKTVALYLRVSSVDQHPETQLYDLRSMAQQRVFKSLPSTPTGSPGRKLAGLVSMICSGMRAADASRCSWSGPRTGSPGPYATSSRCSTNLNRVRQLPRKILIPAGPLGRAVVIIIGAIAELERNLIIERGRAGMRRARLEGRHIGRRPLDIDRVAVLQERARGQSLSEIANTHRISRATVRRLLKQAKEPAAPSI